MVGTHLEIDLLGLVILTYLLVAFIRYKPSVRDIHDLVEMANTKGGIILILWITSLVFFVAGLRMSYWGITLQKEHPGDTTMAYLNAAFNWISGSAFAGAFGAMIATMKGDPVTPSAPSEKKDEVKKEAV